MYYIVYRNNKLQKGKTMNEKVKELITPGFHKNLKQVAPYIVEFDDTLMYMTSYLHCMAMDTGSTFKFLANSSNGKTLWKISDPLCKILEDTGMNA
jgi:hypothetical protein